MLRSLQHAFGALLKDACPDLFGGSPPAVAMEFSGGQWTFDADSVDATAGEPAPEDARDVLTFDPATPDGPYTLSRVPYPGPRRVWLRNGARDRLALGAAEVTWDVTDPRAFVLHPKPVRVLEGYDEVEVLYGVTAVFTKQKVAHQLSLLLRAGDEETLGRAEAMVLAVFALNRDVVLAGGAFSHSSGDYRADGEIKALSVRSGAAPGADTRVLVLDAEVELKVSRALAEDEGRPIERILSPGAAPGERAVDVRIDVEA